MATTTRTARAPRDTANPKEAPTTGRLGKGGLQELVLAHLTRQRGEEFTPNQVGNALGRSSGAVGNALSKFARDDESPVVQTSTKPRRYSVPKARTGRTRTKR